MTKKNKINTDPNHASFWERNEASDGILLKETIKKYAISIFRAILLFGMCFMIIQPILNKISVSIMSEADLYDTTIVMVPKHFTLANWKLVNLLMNYKTTLFNTIWVLFIFCLLFPSPQHLSDIHGMHTGLEAVIPLLGGVVAEVLLRLVPCGHGLALYHQLGLLIVGGAVVGVGHMEAEGFGLVSVATAVLAHVLPDLGVVELHDGEAWVTLHELIGVACRCDIHRHRSPLVAEVVSDAAPADGHGVALRGVAAAKDEVLGEECEAVFSEVLLHIKRFEFCIHCCVVFVVSILIVVAAAGHHGQQQGEEKKFFHRVRG